MNFTKLLSFLAVLLISIIPKTTAQFEFKYKLCGDNYTNFHTYQTNLNTTLNSMSSDTRIKYGYYNFTSGKQPDKVEAMALCRSDVTVDSCRSCVRSSVATLPTICHNTKDAFGYSEDCLLYYTNYSAFHVLTDQPYYALRFDGNVTNMPNFNSTLTKLMYHLKNQASLGDSETKFATGKLKISSNQSLYGLVQCSPDLSMINCGMCVQSLIDNTFSSYFITVSKKGSLFMAEGARVVAPSCNVRYELYPFYGNVTYVAPPPIHTPQLPQSPASQCCHQVHKSKNGAKLGPICVSIAASIILVMSIISIILSRRKRPRKTWMVKFNEDEIKNFESLQFSLCSIKHATHNFSDDHQLGQGGFGIVYKGVLPDGQEIAVKRLKMNKGQGGVQFKTEILILAKLRHINLVKLQGFCLENKEMILIYEFVANRSLDNFIYDPLKRQSMSWKTRYKIIVGVAKGILYLHENSRQKVIHCDLKAANVLLDTNFNPKIADFGMARLFKIDQSHTFASKVVGTLGYISPEYALQNHVSVKLDVYSYGILILEIISGQKITSFLYQENQENLLGFAWRNWKENTGWNLVDPAILSNNSNPEILRCIHIGLLCVQHKAEDRPTMTTVDIMLSSNSVQLQVPAKPAFFAESMVSKRCSTTTDHQEDIRSGIVSINGVTITELEPRS